MKVLVIHNPVSGRKKILNPGWACKLILDKKKVGYDWFETIPQAKQPYENLHFSSYQRIIVIGGDGTIRELISFLIKNRLKIPIAIVPSGTANVLALSLDIPIYNPTAAISLGLSDSIVSLDLGIINHEEYFIIGCGKGVDSLMHKTLSRATKRKFGFLAYLFGTLKQLFHFRRLSYTLKIDQKIYHFKARTILVFNLLDVFGLFKKYHINPQDGYLNVVVLQASTFWGLGRLLLKLMQGVAHTSAKSGLIMLKGKKIQIKTKERKIPIEVDGDNFESDLAEIDVLPKAVAIISKKKFID